MSSFSLSLSPHSAFRLIRLVSRPSLIFHVTVIGLASGVVVREHEADVVVFGYDVGARVVWWMSSRRIIQ